MIAACFTLAKPGFDLDVEFTASSGVTAIFGPSGSGKTTILNAIAGLERPRRGMITVDETVFYDSSHAIDLATHRRRIGYVFQDALLFPHLTVRDNLRYGYKTADVNFDDTVAVLGLSQFLDRRPAKLSGGERQRVAIGRALLSSPRLLLMDEPLASLDMEKKQEILPLIERLRDNFQVPILFVSHAVDEVARLADQVLVIDKGRITARGTPDEALARHLQTAETRFQRVSVLHGNPGSYDEAFGLTTLLHPAGPISIAGKLTGGRDIRIVVHATDVTLATVPPRNLSVRTALRGKIASIESDEGPTAIVNVTLDGGQLLSAAATRKAIAALQLGLGREVWCLIKSVSIDERWLRSG